MNCEDVPTGEDWGDVTGEKQEAMEASQSCPYCDRVDCTVVHIRV